MALSNACRQVKYAVLSFISPKNFIQKLMKLLIFLFLFFVFSVKQAVFIQTILIEADIYAVLIEAGIYAVLSHAYPDRISKTEENSLLRLNIESSYFQRPVASHPV